MKKFTLIFLIIVSLINAQSNEEIISEANNAYQNQNYKEAVTLYKSLVDNGFAGAELFYNLGNSYFKTDQIGYAILYYEKALKYNPGDEDVIHNLKIANSRTIDKIKEVPQLFIIEWINYYLALFSVSTWSVILYLFYLSLIISIGFFFLSRKIRLKRVSLYSALISFVFMVIFSISLFVKVNQETTSNYAVLVSQSVTAKNSPDQQSNDAFVINEGTKFLIEDSLNDWGRIKLADGKVGWIPKSAFEKI
ncbi:MAG: tetratricopeptide repeat protein [Melioribacteraceae bacterium]|nr:tetratricopeptide repeat protein [Melioribacteraceae bacterium]